MTNYEYFKDEIIDMVMCGGHLAVVDEKPASCDCTPCGKCYANVRKSSESCQSKLKSWLNAEHIEKPKLTKKERQFCELVETGWICRDGCGHLNYRPYANKPHKDLCVLSWKGNVITGTVLHCINATLPIDFSFITWDDKEPWSVEELLKLEVEE